METWKITSLMENRKQVAAGLLPGEGEGAGTWERQICSTRGCPEQKKDSKRTAGQGRNGFLVSVGYWSPDKRPQGSASAPLPIILHPIGTHPVPGTVQGPTGEAQGNGLGPCSPGYPRPRMPIEQEL